MASDYDAAGGLLVQSILAGDTKVDNRERLGAKVPIQLFQAMRLVALGSAMEDMIGDGSRALVYQAGQRLGNVLGGAVMPQAEGDLDKYVGLIQGVTQELGIGFVVIDKVDLDAGEINMHLDECVSCAGITGMSAPICNFEAGMVGGLIKTFVGRSVKAVETRCHAIGDKTCGVDVKIL
ncbi:MAG: 4-vinyl reductase [Deltaproteobacteria bacterium]|nr:MAG: 4-vinyl reductase [Deltaproteobacteria bacterium]